MYSYFFDIVIRVFLDVKNVGSNRKSKVLLGIDASNCQKRISNFTWHSRSLERNQKITLSRNLPLG